MTKPKESQQTPRKSNLLEEFTSYSTPSAAALFFRSLRKARLAIMGLFILAIVVATALFAPWLAPHDPEEVTLRDRLKPPVWETRGSPKYILGTDSLGRDSLSRLIYGSRISVLVGFSAVLIAGTLGVIIGVIGGYYRGPIDDVFMRIADIQLSFPFILLAIAVLSVTGPGLMNIIVVLGLTSWVSYARVARGQVMSLREREFVEAAQVIGAKNRRIIFTHLLPNIMTPIIVIASFDVAAIIIAEASLSFLGLGVPPSIPTWGSMLADGREYIYEAWWMATFPGIAIMLTVLGINVVGDWLRDYLDPRLSHEQSF